MSSEQIRVITLEEGEHLTSVVRKFEKGWLVRFVRGSTLLGCDVQIKTTLTGESPLEWKGGEDHLSAHCDVQCNAAGSFRYTFTVDGSSWDSPSGSGYFLVMPTLGVNGSRLPMDAIICQTYLTKLLGPFSEWEDRLRVAFETGYNMVHLTPIHELGISDSSYSLKDHHSLIASIHSPSHKATFEDVAQLVAKMEQDWGMLTVQDVVWNHAAKNAPWLQEHPESAYNCWNSPHLRPAYVLDRLYHYFSKEVSEGVWESRGIPSVVDNIHHVNAIEYVLRTEVLPKVRLHEFYQIEVDPLIREFEDVVKTGPAHDPVAAMLGMIPDPEWRRFGATVDLHMANKIFNVARDDVGSEEERVFKCVEAFRLHLEYLNMEGGKKSWDVVMAGLNAMIGHMTYERIADHGPRKGAVTEKEPLICDYFQHLEAENGWEEDEKLAYDKKTAPYLMAFNGWVMCDNPLKNFALSDSEVYLRRELVCWGDSVKLNYGEKPEDCPFLWNYMKEYTQKCARMFHGLRIDNAHGTPIHVAEYLLLAAREIRQDLYVFAELFTGSEHLDNMFVNRLGISSLIREAQSAGDSHEQGRLVYRYGGDCVGAMIQKSERSAPSSIAHALFLDQSHDNPTPILTRSVFDLLPTAAMLSMASCASGSNRGYDELVRHAIHVVTETRPYARWGTEVNEHTGITAARKVLNYLHAHLAKENYTEVFVDQMSPDIVAVTRHNPVTHSTVVVVSHTAFNKENINRGRVFLKHIPVGGVLEEVLFEMKTIEASPAWGPESRDFLKGLDNVSVEVREHIEPEKATMCELHGGREGYIELTNLPSGSVIGFKIRLDEPHHLAVDFVRRLIYDKDTELDRAFTKSLQGLSLLNFNRLLFTCEEEEHVNIGQGSYEIPNFGKFVYCGLQGLMPVLERIREHNDLGHPVCQNLREGGWLADYIHSRLRKYKGLEKIADQFQAIFEPLKNIPYYLRPCYFEACVSYLYQKTREALFAKLPATVNMSSAFVQALILSSVSFTGFVRGAELAPISPSLGEEEALSISAGLPHFSTGIWRNWGRDTFIALPGCLLVSGRFDDARKVILSFAGCLRHGLIPNLLAEGKGARYNCRDAVWFWLASIVRYVQLAPNGKEILDAPVRRLYLSDKAEFLQEEKEQPLSEVIVEALQKHFEGISFRERNAGNQIDEHMRDEGFNVTAFVDKETGFIHGGNQWNCGTWMDKMGSSEAAGNRGEPATPRDGAAVELQGLASFSLSALADWHKEGLLSSPGVSAEELTWTWSDWSQKIRQSFEKHFYVSEESSERFVNRRKIVKDSVGSAGGFTDYQLRCNLVIALATDPTILDPRLAWDVLDTVRDVLMGPIGIKTLDPTDWAYNGFYNNNDHGTDKKTAHGWNYHQGPEWVWVAGFYLKARLVVGRALGDDYWSKALKEVRRKMGNYWAHIQNSAWRSLPELTQENGAECPASCAAQAWSVGCLLEVCEEIKKGR